MLDSWRLFWLAIRSRFFSTSFGFGLIDFSGDFLGRLEDDEVHRGPHHFLVGGVMLCPPPHPGEVLRWSNMAL